MSAPWLTVIVPVFNGGTYLDAALGSILREADPGIETLVIDGGSTDGSVDLIRRYGERMEIRLMERRDLPDWMTKTNVGFQEARGERISMLHQDDAWLPGRLAAIRAALAADPEIDLLLHDVQFMDAEGKPLGVMRYPLPHLPETVPAPGLVAPLLVQNFIAVPTPIIRREAALAVGGIDPALWYTGDWDFYLKLAARCRSGHIRRTLAAFRVHGASMTMTGSRRLAEFRAQMQTVLDRHAAFGPDTCLDRSIARQSRLSIAVNTALAGLAAGDPAGVPPALRAVLAAGPVDSLRYIRTSRILERLKARTSGKLLLSLVAGRAP